MHIAIIDGDVSYPANSGKRLRTLNLMLQAAKKHEITYIGRCAPGSEEAESAPAFLRDHNIEPILVPHPIPRKSGLAFYGRLLANLSSSQPYSVTSHKSRMMRQAVSEFANRRPVDVWQLEWAPYLETVDHRISGARVVMAHNVDTLIWQRYYENESHLLRKMFFKTQWRKFSRFEKLAFRRASRVVAVSEDDARIIRETFGQSNVDVVDNGIDRPFFEQVQGHHDPATILFLGALDWRPNLDAVGLLLEKIFPIVLDQEPSAKLVIVGRNPPSIVAERISHSPQVELHANVADVRSYLASAGVMAVPLRIGGGSRLKILEALACGLPVVSTRVGAEGLLLKPGEHFVLADEETMGTALVQAIRNSKQMQAMAAQGRDFVLKMYDWQTLAKKLERTWEVAVGAPVRSDPRREALNLSKE